MVKYGLPILRSLKTKSVVRPSHSCANYAQCSEFHFATTVLKTKFKEKSFIYEELESICMKCETKWKKSPEKQGMIDT
jgi:hypothetical protein